MKLTDNQIGIIEEILQSENIMDQSLYDEAFDHLCCVSEEGFDEQSDFRLFIESEIKHFAPQGFTLLEHQINYASQTKSLIIMKKFMYILGLVATIALATGVLFKIMHWPAANILLFSGQMALFLVYVPFICITKLRSHTLKSSLDKWTISLGLIASLIISISILFKVLHLMGANPLLVLGMAVLIFGFIPLQFISFYRKNAQEPKQID